MRAMHDRRERMIGLERRQYVAIRILIVDDHTMLLKGLRLFLAPDPDLEVVGEANDGESAVAMAQELQPDVILMDLLMPGMDGIAATSAIHRALPSSKIIMLTGVLESASIAAVLRAGASGYLLKDTKAADLRQAIKATVAQQVQLSPQVAELLVNEHRTSSGPAPLTERESAVLKLLAQGRANKEVARELSISETTVKTHVSTVLGKLGVQSRTQAALYAVQAGLVPAEHSPE